MVFGTALSGIQASTNELEVIGHNIANSSTTGFKSSRAEFADVYASGAFGGGGNAIGSGVRLSRVQQSFEQGGFTLTNNSLDLGINGGGFFVLSNNGARSYSRAGAFTMSNDGFVENSLHQRLQGLGADDLGNISNSLGDINISQANILPHSTTAVTVGLNLYANSPASSFDWTGGTSPAVNTYNNTTSSIIYDSLGNSHTLSMCFIKSDQNAATGAPNASSPAGSNNQWYVAFQIDNQDVPPNIGTHNTDNLYRINFNPDGSFKNTSDLSDTAFSSSLIPLSLSLNNGADPLSFSVDLTDSTQFGSQFAVQNNNQDGYTTGRLEGLNIADSGVIYGRYTNGRSRAMGQVELANFANPDGLQSLGDTMWAETASSGQPVISKPGTASLGVIMSGALEDSNVDLTGELVKLISAQRNFQANAQTIKTADAVTQTIINIR